MKKLLLVLALMSVAAVANAQLLITGVFDGPLTGGIPKFVELYACDDILDLSVYGIGSASNGGGTDGVEFAFPSGFVAGGTSLYVNSETTAAFSNYFGFPYSFSAGTSVSINGDDAIELFYIPKAGGSPIVVDTFGDITYAVGAGPTLAWNYLDGYAKRVTMTGPDGGAFVLSNWTFSGMNATDLCTTNATCAKVYPVGGFVCDQAVDAEAQSFGALKAIFR